MSFDDVGVCKYKPVHPTQTGAMSCGLCKRNEGNLQKEKRVKEGISLRGGGVKYSFAPKHYLAMFYFLAFNSGNAFQCTGYIQA